MQHQSHPNALFQYRGESKLGLNQQKRFNSLSVLNAYADIVDNLSLMEVAERSANGKERHRNGFGTFPKKDLHEFFR